MKMMKLKTTLMADEPGCHCGCKAYKTIAKGATAILSYKFSDPAYADGFKQLTLILREPSGSDLVWQYYSESGLIDSHFSYDELTETVDFALSGEETGELMESDPDCPTLWEIALATKDDYTIIEPQPPIVVVGSLYNDSKGHGAATPYASERTLCSSTLTCND